MFKTILKTTQKELKAFCASELKKYYKGVQNRKAFIYCKGELPVLLVAHLDTVHKQKPTAIYHDQEQDVMWSPQGIGGDDRCGIFAILTLLERGYRPHILFTTDEEIGGVGAQAFVTANIPLDGVKYMVELDRRGEKDMVFYDCGNEDFMAYVGQFGFEEEYGTFSDISTLSPAYDLASVNLSIGYYQEHRTEEHIKLKHMMATVDKVELMLLDSVNLIEPFDYQESISWVNTSYYTKKTTPLTQWWEAYGYGSEDEFWEEEMGYSHKTSLLDRLQDAKEK